MKAGTACAVHAYHWPPLKSTAAGNVVLDSHHVWPLGMGGPDILANRVWTCPTGHRKIHAALRALIDGVEPMGTRAEVRLARRGFDAWQAADRPGRPELLAEILWH